MLNTDTRISESEGDSSDTAGESSGEEAATNKIAKDASRKRKVTDTNGDEDDTKNNEETDDESNNTNSDDDTNAITNEGWADSIAKILKTKKPKGKKTLVLSKAKKLVDVKKLRPTLAGFEVEAKDGEVKQEQIIESIVKPQVKSKEPLRKRKRELPNLRKKPDILEKDRERTLAKIATKGVVQLFNVVKTQQKDISAKLEQAGPMEIKRDKVLKNVDKRAILDVLMGEQSQAVDDITERGVKRKSESKTQTWGVLRDDFMMGAKLKDWDKELEDEDETERDVEIE